MTRTHDHSTDARPEHVMLDLGPGVGALVLHTDKTLHGMEIEISPAGHDARRQHKDVLERQIAGEPAFTAVFDRIPEGRHTLWVNGEARAREVEVEAGIVAELDWRSR